MNYEKEILALRAELNALKRSVRLHTRVCIHCGFLVSAHVYGEPETRSAGLVRAGDSGWHHVEAPEEPTREIP